MLILRSQTSALMLLPQLRNVRVAPSCCAATPALKASCTRDSLRRFDARPRFTLMLLMRSDSPNLACAQNISTAEPPKQRVAALSSSCAAVSLRTPPTRAGRARELSASLIAGAFAATSRPTTRILGLPESASLLIYYLIVKTNINRFGVRRVWCNMAMHGLIQTSDIVISISKHT